MTNAPLGLALFLATLLVGRFIKIRLHIEPRPWWLGEELLANLITPALVSSFVLGLAVLASGVVVEQWSVLAPASLAGFAAGGAVFYVLWRMMSAWSRRLDLAAAPVAQAAQNDPAQPPRVPPMKKAA